MPSLPFEEGMCLRGEHRFEEALVALRTTLAEQPHVAAAWFWLATTLNNLSREAEAIPAYRRALDLGLTPNLQPKALTWLASSLAKTGQPAEATELLARAEALGGYRPAAEFEAIAANVREAILDR